MPAKAVYLDLDTIQHTADEKFCGGCKTTKSAANFYRSRYQRDGLQSQCKTCQHQQRSVWNDQNPVRLKEQRRRADVRRKFGITLEQYNQLMQSECEVCGGTGDSLGRMALDHDHKTGAIRGVLCGKCNMALGLCTDDPSRLRALADYLERG